MSKKPDHDRLNRRRTARARELAGEREIARFFPRVPEREPPPRPDLKDSRGRRISLAPVSILKKGRPPA